MTGGAATLIALDSALAFSAPRSAKMNLVAAPDCSFDKLEHAWPDATPQRIDLRLRVRPTAPWKTSTTIFSINFQGATSASACQLLFNLDSDGSKLTVAALILQVGPMFTTTRHMFSSTPKQGEWNDLGLSVRSIGGVPNVSATIGGVTALADTPAPGCALGGAVAMGVGFHCDNGSAEMRADDVVFDFD
jgi:hypothetical protein